MAAPVTLPKLSTPQQYAAFFNAHLNKGKPIAGVPFPGATVGDQWTAFLANRQAALGTKYSLYDYAAAFLAEATVALLNTDLQAGISGGATTAATLGADAAQGGLSIYQQGLLGFIARLGSSAVWLRVAKVVVGGVLLVLGLARMTGADKVAGSITKHVPIPV